MNVRFYFDPICPWCWITSRWIEEEVVPGRGIEVDWRSISLLVRNEGRDMPAEYLEPTQWTFKMLRVAEALRADGKADLVGALYTELGNRIHRDQDKDFTMADALSAAGIDTSYAAAFDDPSFDDAVRASTAEAEGLAGADVGTPIIAYEVDGTWKGYFGPVIPEVVRGDAALRLWDGLAALIATDGFYEIKKTRDVGPQIPGRA